MARTVASNKHQHQQNDNDDDDEGAQSFSGAAFAVVPVPCDILQQWAVNQDEDEAKRASQDNENRVE
jgi:hypothetical protein